MLDFKKSIIIAAHPDDEVLWFSSAMRECSHIVICFGPANSQRITKARKEVEALYPLEHVTFLTLREPGAFLKANWHAPQFGTIGLDVEQNQDKYHRTYETLLTYLQEHLTPESHVLTHNPWGEYGHEEHILVFEAVKALRDTLGFEMYVSNYVSDRSHSVMQERQVWIDGVEGPFATDQTLAQKVTDLYIKTGCWTFPDEYVWPNSECFLHISHQDHSQTKAPVLTASPPLNYLSFGFQEAKLKSFAIRKTPARLRQFIKRVLGKS